MAKSKTLDQQLAEEVKPQVQDLFDQIQQLETEAENKQAGIERFKQEIENREQEVEQLREEAGQVLAQGGDPLPTLDKLNGAEAEIQGMKDLLQKTGDPAQVERNQVEQLKKELQRKMVNLVNQSEAVKSMQGELEYKIQDIKDFVESWSRAENELFSSFRVNRAGNNNFKLSDKKLVRFSQQFLGNLF